jgi:hypothetical protein
MLYFSDPKNSKPSVSLTAFIITFVIVLGFGIANALGYVEKEPGPLMELFYASAALYFGRRVSLGQKQILNEKDKESKSE